MSKIGIETAHNVHIEYEPANLGDRIIAYMIDYFIILAYLLITYALFFSIIFNSDMRSSPASDTFIIIFIVAGVAVIILPPVFYHLFFEIFNKGQSIGKRQKNLRVVRLDGSQPTIGNYLIRWLLRPIDEMFSGIVGILVVVSSDKGQRIGDMAAGTTVVKMKPSAHTLEDVMAVKNWESIQDENFYEPVYLQVTALSEKDIRVIKEVLEKHKKDQNNELIVKLAAKLAEVLQVKAPETNVLGFLETVLKDYYYLSK